tara:strand:+ start:2339 stop:3778 length:1440 start_codon:yes stop_codon:yes gene_type:complete
MSITFIHKVNDVHLQVECEPHIARELSSFFEFEVPGAKFMPAYRNRLWDGKIRLFSQKTCKIYVGLLSYLEDFFKNNELEYVLHDNVKLDKNIDVKDVDGFIKSLKIPFETRDYQFNGICKAIEKSRGLFVSPTASGKSLIIYCLVRYFRMMNKKILVLVPTTSLVEQMTNDFVSYGWNEKHIHKVYSGHDKNSDKPVIISTWQSLYKLPKSYFKQFQCIFGDEAHTFKAKSLTNIMEKLEECPYRFGFTGTLDGTQTHRLVLEGLFGKVEKVITTKELIDKKTLAQLNANCIILKYKEEECKEVKDYKYSEEINFLASHQRRNKFITDLCKKLSGNTLCLFQLVEKHGNILYDMLNDENTYYVHGGTSAEEREKIREVVNQSKKSIIVASYGTFSTGINIPNLHNIVFASPSKSRIRVLQSIGRGLRKAETKDSVLIYDLSDDLTYKSKKNFTLLHFEERINIYNEESFSYRIDTVKI